MMKICSKRWNVCLMILACVLMSSVSRFTVEAKDKEIGIIHIELTDGVIDISKENVMFAYEKVADIVNGEYILTEEYKSVDVNLNEIDCSDELSKATEIINSAVTTGIGTVVTDKEGKAKISDLETGVYLLWVSERADFDEVHPSLITIPTWDEEQKTMLYEVTVYPKHSIMVSPKTPQTGDGNEIILYGRLMLAMAVVISVIAIAKLKMKHKNR